MSHYMTCMMLTCHTTWPAWCSHVTLHDLHDAHMSHYMTCMILTCHTTWPAWCRSCSIPKWSTECKGKVLEGIPEWSTECKGKVPEGIPEWSRVQRESARRYPRVKQSAKGKCPKVSQSEAQIATSDLRLICKIWCIVVVLQYII